jgi:Ca2+:H+ antiporter
MPRWLYFLLIFAVLAPILEFLHVPALLLFAVAGLGIVPLAALIGQSVEGVAEHTGERIGGLLFATFGNATELIISILALTKGLVDVVTASIIGSILGNAMLVLGIATCVGCFKHGRLRFEVRSASHYSSLLALTLAGLLLPTVAQMLAQSQHQSQIMEHGILLSDVVAIILLIGYVASILFSVFHVGDHGGDEEEEDFDPVIGARSATAIARLLAYRHHLAQGNTHGKTDALAKIDSAVKAIVAQETATQSPLVAQSKETPASTSVQPGGEATQTQPETKPEHKPSLWLSILLLAVATAGVAVLSEILVGSIEPMTEALGWNPAFVGLVFLPLIGGLPEYFNTISMALDKRMDMVLTASAGSSIQIAMLMTPLLVLLSLFMPVRLDLIFSVLELVVLALAMFLFSEITRDGELVWVEGLLLVLVYAIMGGAVFLFG